MCRNPANVCKADFSFVPGGGPRIAGKRLTLIVFYKLLSKIAEYLACNPLHNALQNSLFVLGLAKT
jgi:hypothetical protein